MPDIGGARSAAEQIPAGMLTAVLDYTGPGARSGQPTRPAAHRVVSGTDLTALVDTLNALQFTIELSGCRNIDVIADGVAQPVLEASQTDSLRREIYGALGIRPVASQSPPQPTRQ